MQSGKWIMFLDPNQNIFSTSQTYDFALDYLKEIYRPFVRKLSQNCRNTEQIGRRTAVVTSIPPAKHMKISGPNVVSQPYLDDKDLQRLLKKDIGSYLGSGNSIKDITILSRYRKINSGISTMNQICGYDINEVSDISFVKEKSINYYTVQSFKGLESKVIFSIDMNGFDTPYDRMVNYVAMSRAKIMLYMYYPIEKKDEYTEAVLRGQDLLV
ncbi:MAG: hypothetical protein PHR06_16180 [Candidatus Cloacimonetes bacterium]|nr:hypothetical protein [Candidatus Cloacimonadota bacterium]